MHFTDLFIRKPVLATVISLLILVLGIRSVSSLPIRQYPYTQNAVVTVTTAYTGADPSLVAGFITTPLENSIAQANGIDYLMSSSSQSISTIQATLRLNYDPNKAITEINTKINAVLNQLPQGSQQPSITVDIGDPIDSMYMGFSSKVLPSNKITDYLIRVVQPKLQTVPGVQTAEILGGRQFALRAWLDPTKMSAYGITPADVSNALAANDFISAAGRTKGNMISVDLTAETGLHTVDEFRNLILKSQNGAIIRLGDVANVTLGAESYDTSVGFDGKEAVYVGIKVAPSANLLTVIKNVRQAFTPIQQQLPEGLNGEIVYDATKYVNAAIHDVVKSLIEALLIVTGVIFLFLGSARSVSIPIIAMPLSLVGTFFIMLVLGYSINLLTLLALVLAIGLVVDDAIIVVENVHRHMEDGLSAFNAAIIGAKELTGPIIAMTVVLISVYIPIGFMEGLTGALFTEFAFTLAGAVVISAIVALTLSPMMCSKMLKHENKHNESSRLAKYTDYQFERLRHYYQTKLHTSLNYLTVTLVFAIIILISIYLLYITSKSELAPQEDQGIIIASITTAPNASLNQTKLYSKAVFNIFNSYPETDHIFQIEGLTGLNSALAGMVLKPWNERTQTSNDLQPILQQQLSQISGAQIAAFQLPSLPGGGRGLPMQFVINSTDNYTKINDVAQTILAKAYASGMFLFLDSDLKLDKAQTIIQINRDKASQLGLTMQTIGNVLASALSENYINYFSFYGRSYKVIPQVMGSSRLNASQLLNYYITAANGTSVPLSTIASLKTIVVPESINHFQQLNSATISGVPMPGITMGEALQTMQHIAKQVLPQGYGIDYAGQSRQYMQESTALMVTFFFALIFIYLTLAALFESFRDPLIVMLSVPMSICGALIFISLGIKGASLNIYTEVGLVTLIGLITKHGILIVQFANDLQKEGKSKREAVEHAAAIRLRPILMTTGAMVMGVVPLILATGAGAVSRFNIGLVIASGLAIGTVFTLFVVPAMYMFIGETHHAEGGEEVLEVAVKGEM
jgi:multidrug efflux pump